LIILPSEMVFFPYIIYEFFRRSLVDQHSLKFVKFLRNSPDNFRVILPCALLCQIKPLSHDYSSSGKYFITVCTHRMVRCFGNISCDKMILSESGQIANIIWYELAKHFSFVSLDEFVVMSIISPKPGSLATVIRSYKSAVSKNVRGSYFEFLSSFRSSFKSIVA
jgi:hypothetical protein